MYATEEDVVVALFELPKPDAGTPEPLVLAKEGGCFLAYMEPERDGAEYWVLAEFDTQAIYLGSPNDKSLNGHPLYHKGLGFYDCFEVKNSSWIRLLEIRNRIHPQHNPAMFSELRHFIVTFHDSTFECVARSFTYRQVKGTRLEMLAEIRTRVS